MPLIVAIVVAILVVLVILWALPVLLPLLVVLAAFAGIALLGLFIVAAITGAAFTLFGKKTPPTPGSIGGTKRFWEDGTPKTHDELKTGIRRAQS